MDNDQFNRLMQLLGRIESRLAARPEKAASEPWTTPSTHRTAGPLGRLIAPSGGAGSGLSALSSLPALSDVPVLPALPPLLDVLEDVQIEGAEVLPEVTQSLEEIDKTLGDIKGASGSMAPAPNKVPEIKTALQSNSQAIQSTLDSL